MSHSAPHDEAAAVRGQWMALAAALLGWMFDGAEMGVFSMVGMQALKDLMSGHTPAEQGVWFGVITAFFLIGAATGGVVFGWLGDRIGRVRAMTLSVLVYALFTGLCGLVGEAWQLGVLRFLAALGMGGEWSLGVALVMEVWPNRSRAFMAGLIGAAANVGYLMVGFVGLALTRLLGTIESTLVALNFSPEMIEQLLRNDGWRILMMLGTTPALLTFFIRIFVPESERWLQEKESGAVSHWANRDLWGVLLGALGPTLIIVVWANDTSLALRVVATLAGLATAIGGYTYPVIQYLKRQATVAGRSTAEEWQPIFRRMLLAAALSGVALLGTWGAAQWGPRWASELTQGTGINDANKWTQIASSLGAIAGTILAAMAGDWWGRRMTYVLMCVTSFVSVLAFYQGPAAYDTSFLIRAGLMGFFTASFYGWLPLYLPELFATNVRATGQGFGFNFGRILAAIGALQVGNLFKPFELFGYQVGGQPFACSAMAAIYIVGALLIFAAPETRGKPLPD